MTDTDGKVKIGPENAEAPFDYGAICIKLDLAECEVIWRQELVSKTNTIRLYSVKWFTVTINIW